MNPRRVSDNEIFITLISAAAKDRELADAILSITNQSETTRKLQVLQLAQACQAKGAPPDFLSALIYLGESHIAGQVQDFLSGTAKDSPG